MESITATSCLAVNGTPFTGTGLLGHAFRTARVGFPLELTIVPKDAPLASSEASDLPVTSSPFNSWNTFSDLVVEFLLPGVFSAARLLGCLSPSARSDGMAVAGTHDELSEYSASFIVEGWPPGWRVAGLLYESTLGAIFPIIIFLFGRFFPEPFPRGSRYDRIWRALQWFCAFPFAIFARCGIAVSVGSLTNYRSVAGLYTVLKPLQATLASLRFHPGRKLLLCHGHQTRPEQIAGRQATIALSLLGRNPGLHSALFAHAVRALSGQDSQRNFSVMV